MRIILCLSAAEGNCGEKGIEAEPAKNEDAELRVVSVAFLKEEQGKEQDGGKENSGQQGREEPEQFLEAEKKPGAFDVQNT